MPANCRRLPWILCIVAIAAGTSLRAADLRPSWECLPEDTVALVRLPRPAEFLETLRTRTKFGAVMLGADRLRKAMALAMKHAGGADAEASTVADLEEEFAKYGLGPADLEAAFAGDMGLGVVTARRGADLPPLMMALAWMEPGTDAAERMVGAFHRMLEEQADDEHPPQRVDLELAGHSVTWVTRPILQVDLGEFSLDGDLDPERLEKLREEMADRAARATQVVVGKLHLFLARLGGRLVVGQTMPATPAAVKIGVAPGAGGLELNVDADEAPAAAVDPDRLAGGDEARAIFERFLAAHTADAGAPVADLLQAPGVRATLPGGTPLVEAVLDPRPLLAAATGDDAEAARRAAAVGLADLGPVALRLAFDAGRLRQGIFATLPAPRAGLFRIFDQPCDAAEVPAFVTSEAVSFSQISLDLAAAYRTIKEFVVAEGGEDAATMVTNGEAQAGGWLGVELEDLLASIGSRHWIVTYPAQVAAAIDEARRARAQDAAAGPPAADRLALVWPLADDAPALALLPKVAALAQTQVVEEQGFQGMRLPGGNLAVFVGQGHLVFGMGGDALEKTLAGIRNPPAGAASFRDGGVPRTAAELVELAPCRMFQVGDATRTGGLLGEFREFVTAMTPDDVAEDSREWLTDVKSLMPPAEEMEGMFGVAASVMKVNDAGIALESAWEMPAP